MQALSFLSQPSNDAMMALSELMKLDTSPHYQTSLNAFSDEALVKADKETKEKASDDEGNYCDEEEMVTI